MTDIPRTSAGHSIADLKTLVKQDIEASNELQARIEILRQDIKDGKKPPKKKIDLMEVSNKDMVKDLITRIDQIEASTLTPTDREMLQALNARLSVCDTQAMRLAELRELEREARGEMYEYLDPEPVLHRTVSAPAAAGHVEPILELVDDLGVQSDAIKAHHSDDDELEHELDHDLVVDESEIMSTPDISTWFAPYRILSINPETPDDKMYEHIKQSMARLAVKNDPKRLPNDPDAPKRWTIIEKARDVLADPEKRRFMDHHQKVPVELEELDLEKLNLS